MRSTRRGYSDYAPDVFFTTKDTKAFLDVFLYVFCAFVVREIGMNFSTETRDIAGWKVEK